MIFARINHGVCGLVNRVDEYSNLHEQLNNYQSADSTKRRNHVAVTCLSLKGRSSKQVAEHPAGNAGTDTTRLTQFQIYAILGIKELK
jgi:hypothetical protein